MEIYSGPAQNIPVLRKVQQRRFKGPPEQVPKAWRPMLFELETRPFGLIPWRICTRMSLFLSLFLIFSQS